MIETLFYCKLIHIGLNNKIWYFRIPMKYPAASSGVFSKAFNAPRGGE